MIYVQNAHGDVILSDGCMIPFVCFSAISDTCLAMEEWVENPHAETALSNILPCVDQRTTNHTLTQSKQVINSIVNVVNTYIYTFSNSDPSPDDNRYYNQSGPPMPPLCYPFDSQLQDRQCGSSEVSMANASLVFLSNLILWFGCFFRIYFLLT